jgi:hypothetical protein
MVKTNNIVEWTVVNRNGTYVESCPTRKIARIYKNWMNEDHMRAYKTKGGFRIAKVMVTK